MTPAERWLRHRCPDAPSALLDAMSAALPPTGTVPDALAEAALALYGRVVHGCGGREDALPLLAADALLTHAFQAQAELHPDALDAAARRWGVMRRLGEMVQ